MLLIAGRILFHFKLNQIIYFFNGAIFQHGLQKDYTETEQKPGVQLKLNCSANFSRSTLYK